MCDNDFHQTKLTATEWGILEIPVSDKEKSILQLIIDGFHDPNIKKNAKTSMFSFTKIEATAENEDFLYTKYFAPIISKTLDKYGTPEIREMYTPPTMGGGNLRKIKSADAVRFQNLEANVEKNRADIFEFFLLDFCNMMCRYLGKQQTSYSYYLYTLIQLKNVTIRLLNRHVVSFMNAMIEVGNRNMHLCDIIENAYEFIERNPHLLANEDKQLYTHQKALFSLFNKEHPVDATATSKLVLYCSPTGTGKTLSPIGLAEKMRVIFVCGARHIGLALAKSAISMEKRIAFAFGCDTASDIRLHYFAAVDYTRDRRSGGIRKVDNSNGSKVEIIICDIKSYTVAMHYMLAFNPKEKVVTYWDEPTISMDYPDHPLHELIHRNWIENVIPNVVLSCATLPHETEIMDTLADFRERFDNPQIHNITSYDCKKSISILTKTGICGLPHILFEDYDELQECIRYCDENKTLLRYFDLSEIVRFISYVNKTALLPQECHIDSHFDGIASITMNSLKLYYLELLKRMPRDSWTTIFAHFRATVEPKLSRKKNGKIANAGILFTTEDAYTFTDGPAIFMTEDVAKIGNFYIQQTNIPKETFQKILVDITLNNRLSDRIAKLQQSIEDMDKRMSDTKDDERKGKAKEIRMEKNPEIQQMSNEIEQLRKHVKYVQLDNIYIPNSKSHQEIWAPRETSEAFMPLLDEQTVKDIMGLAIDNYLKVLLLLGIGLFMKGANVAYTNIMKRLADSQHLFMIIASSDYIYGTNYQFCHGVLAKDLANMTQQKTIQAIGRIGRGDIQQSYTVRFREDEMLMKLFNRQPENMEAQNMSRLFSS